MRVWLKLAAVALALTAFVGATAETCAQQGSAPPPSVGHNRDRAGEPDPAPRAPTPSAEVVPLHFEVTTEITAAVTWNAGHGNKFIDSLRAPGESWDAGAPKGAAVYLGAVSAHRGSRGTIVIKITNGRTKKLICVDTNWANTSAGADCHGRAK